MFGPQPIKVPVPPTFDAYATQSFNALANFLNSSSSASYWRLRSLDSPFTGDFSIAALHIHNQTNCMYFRNLHYTAFPRKKIIKFILYTSALEYQGSMTVQRRCFLESEKRTVWGNHKLSKWRNYQGLVATANLSCLLSNVVLSTYAGVSAILLLILMWFRQSVICHSNIPSTYTIYNAESSLQDAHWMW